MAMIKLTGINKIYRTNEIETLALENVNLDVAKGEFVSIMGPSGCGKSTLLNIMGLLDAPSSGKIEINGTSVESMKDKELAAFRNKTLGFVFQSFHLINSLNVIDNVELPLLYRKMAAKERTRLAKEVLERVGLSHRMRHMPTQLSGGQCQRVAIARAIVGNPEIVLADEPTGNLDSKMGAEVMELLHKLNKEDGRTIVMVTIMKNKPNRLPEPFVSLMGVRCNNWRLLHFFYGPLMKRYYNDKKNNRTSNLSIA